LIRYRDDEKSWVKIELKEVSIKELYETCAKRLRVDQLRIRQIHTATVLDDITGKADMEFCKILKQDADIGKQPNGTFLEILLNADFDVDQFLESYLSYTKKNLKDLLSLCEERQINSSGFDTKDQIVDILRDKDFQQLSLKQVMSVADKLNVDWTNCEAKVDIIKIIKSNKK